MNEVGQFDAGHEDLIHDVAYDFYGKRLVVSTAFARPPKLLTPVVLIVLRARV